MLAHLSALPSQDERPLEFIQRAPAWVAELRGEKRDLAEQLVQPAIGSIPPRQGLNNLLGNDT
jgi:hypothetical protein